MPFKNVLAWAEFGALILAWQGREQIKEARPHGLWAY